MSASLDGIVGRDAIESIADVQSAITSGGSITTTTVTASTLNTNQMTIANDQINAIGSSTDIIVNTSASGAFKMDNLQVKTNTLSSTNTDGDIILAPNGAGTVKTDNLQLDGNTISSTNTDGNIVLAPNGAGTVRTDNLQLDGNTISSTDTNGNIVLAPNGVGNIVLGTMTLNADQVIGASEDDYVMTYDHASGTIGLEAGGSSTPWTTVGSDITYNTGDVKVSNLTLSSEEITQSAGSDLRLTTTAKVRVDNLSLDAGTLKAEIGDLTLTCDDTTNKVFIGSLPFKLDQTVGAVQDGYILSYDNSTGKILLEPPTGTSNWTTSGSDIYRSSSVGIGVNSSTINSQLMVKDTGAAHTAVQVTSAAGQNCSVKLSRGAGDWSSSNNETIGMHLDTDSLLFSKLTAEGSNLTGFAGDTMRIDCQNSRVGIASYPYAPSTTLQLGNIGSGRKESLRCSTNAGAGIADRSIEIGVDSTSSFIESNDNVNAPIELQVRQGTNGSVMVIDTSGDVGINTATPTAKLDIGGNTDGQVQAILTRGFDDAFQLQAINESSSNAPGDVVSKFGIRHLSNETALFNFIRGNLGDDGSLAIVTNNAERMRVNSSGDLGIGTTDPKAKIHINGDSNSTAVMSSGARRYFKGISTSTTSDTSTWAFSDASLYATGDIIGSSWIVSLQSTTFSDRRMKENIVDVQDDQCLQKLRLLKPKQYTYKDTHKRGNAPVWGFIAQDVKSTLDYAVSTMEKEIPNIYKLATVSNDGKTLTFSENIVLQDDEPRVMLKTWKDSEVRAVIVSHTSNSITLEEQLEQHDITCDEFTNQIFVYGQIVSDFNHLDKDAIFTVAVSALQEVDRQQQLHKNKISTLEARMSILEQRLNNAGL